MITKATQETVPVLVEHHVAMFREIYTIGQQPVYETRFTQMAVAYKNKLTKQFDDNTCFAWVIKDNETVVASCALSLYEGIPIPTDPNIIIGYLHSVYTVPDHRHKGYASELVRNAISYCSTIGVNRIDLAASDAGRKIYEHLGFTAFSYAMRLITVP